jgi:5-formyltetrahydrofolate cyclo-ligase
MPLLQTDFLDKAEARAYFKKLRAELTAAERESLDSAICEHLKTTVTDSTVLLFYPTKGEPDILPFARYLLCKGVRVAFPISLPDTCELDFRYVERLEDMVLGTYGIHEPRGDAQRVIFPCDCTCIVPALAFDRDGNRAGYGKGYYDRFLAAKDVHTVGVAYEACVVNKLPTNKNDISVDTIITEKGDFLTNAKKYS